MPTTLHPLIACFPIVKRVATRFGARATLTRHLGVPCEIVVRHKHGEIEIALDGDIPGHYSAGDSWVELADGSELSEAISSASASTRDDDWRREMANEAGMAHGCAGYNDTMGY